MLFGGGSLGITVSCTSSTCTSSSIATVQYLRLCGDHSIGVQSNHVEHAPTFIYVCTYLVHVKHRLVDRISFNVNF